MTELSALLNAIASVKVIVNENRSDIKDIISIKLPMNNLVDWIHFDKLFNDKTFYDNFISS